MRGHHRSIKSILIIFKLEKSDKYFDKINNSFLKALSGKTNLPNWILQMDGMSGIKFKIEIYEILVY